MALSDGDLIAMARDANPEHDLTAMLPFLSRFAALAAAKEREACAQIADIQALGWQKSPGANPEAGFIASSNCATAIRARGKPCA